MCWARFCCGLVGLHGASGCEAPAPEVLEPAFVVPDIWPPNREVSELGKRRFIDPTKVERIVPIQLVDGPPVKLETRTL